MAIGKGGLLQSVWQGTKKQPLYHTAIMRKAMRGIPTQTIRSVMKRWLLGETPSVVTEMTGNNFFGPLTTSSFLVSTSIFPPEVIIDAGVIDNYLTACGIVPAIERNGEFNGVSITSAGINIALVSTPTQSQKDEIINHLSDIDAIKEYITI